MSSEAEDQTGSGVRPSTGSGRPEHVEGRDPGSISRDAESGRRGPDSAGSRMRRGLLFVVSAPSGTGKTTVAERLV